MPPLLARFPGNRLIHALLPSFRQVRAPHRRARPPWPLAAWLALAVVAAALLQPASLLSRPDQTAFGSAIAESAPVVHNLRDGDRPRDEAHRELPAKKPRLTTLVVQTTRSAATGGPSGFHLQVAPAADPFHVLRATQGIALCASIAAHRTDPALRLHPGQAPPPAA